MAGVAPLEYLAEQFDQEIGELDNELERLAEDQERIEGDLEELGVQDDHLAGLQEDLAHTQAKLVGLQEKSQELEAASGAYLDNLVRRDTASRRRATAGALRSLTFVLAVIAGLLWLGLAQFPQVWPESISGVLSGWEQKLPWLMYTAIGFGALFVLLWMLSASLNADIDAFAQHAQVLADQLVTTRERFPYEPSASVSEGDAERPEPQEIELLEERVVGGTAEAGLVRELVGRELAWLQRTMAQTTEDQAAIEAAIREEQERLRKAEAYEQELDGCREQVEKRQHKIDVRELAGELLEGATHRISQRFNRNLRELAGRTLPLFTESRYQHLQIGEDLSVRVFASQKKDFIQLEEISSGTQRQIMLAVRLALSQELVDRTVRGPQFLILDEPFAFFDQERALSSLKVLPELSEQLAQVWIIAQYFPDETGFAAHIHCSRDSDHLVHRNAPEARPGGGEPGSSDRPDADTGKEESD
jgi:exonuclease SbcC